MISGQQSQNPKQCICYGSLNLRTFRSLMRNVPESPNPSVEVLFSETFNMECGIIGVQVYVLASRRCGYSDMCQ